MYKMNVEDMFAGKKSRYALVIAVAQRAREITQEQEENQIISDEKPVLTAIREFKDGKYDILQMEDDE